MIVNYKYKLYSTKKNRKLDKLSNTARWITNHCIALQRRYYSLYGKYISKYRIQKHIAKLRKRNKQWQTLGSQTVQMITHSVDESYQRFFKKLSKRPPKFKKKGYSVSFCFTQAGYKLEDNTFMISKVGSFKFFKSRELVGTIKRIRLKKDSCDDWFIVFTIDTPKQSKKSGNAALGFDFGLKTYLTCSDNTTIQSPLFLKQHQKQLSKLNRSLSKKQKGSNNRRKAKQRLAVCHRTIKHKREDFQWKLAHELCQKAKFIAIEDLNVAAMKRLWGKKVSDLAFSEFINKLQYVATKYGTVVHKIDRFFPSSKLCTCGHINDKLTLADRSWTCNVCETTHDRDLLAANNILSEGIRSYSSISKTAILAA